MNKYLISIVGPTAIGKTGLSLKLAQHFNTEIISADSRQFFKEMQIGTAAPTPSELSAAKHHFIHHKSIMDDYNVGTFEKEVLQKLEELFKKYNIILLVGGSGLYVDAVTKGLDYFPDIDPSIREKLNNTLKDEGLEKLQKKLKDLDIKAYNTLELSNPHRVIRALEICIGTNKPYSSFLNKNKQSRNFKTITIGIKAEREIIYNRINNRVDIMVENGLVEEVRKLLPFQNFNALNTVGYKEIFMFLNGNWRLDFAISEIKKNTRRFAKRQLTWFNKNKDCIWFDYNTSTDAVLQAINSKIN